MFLKKKFGKKNKSNEPEEKIAQNLLDKSIEGYKDKLQNFLKNNPNKKNSIDNFKEFVSKTLDKSLNSKYYNPALTNENLYEILAPCIAEAKHSTAIRSTVSNIADGIGLTGEDYFEKIFYSEYST